MSRDKGHILIVDDEFVVRDSLSQWFEAEGYSATPVASGREALAAVAERQFDVALLDIKMPGMDGMELQERLASADPELTVVIMTGYATVETAVRALKRGAWDYITKPVDPDELSHLIAKALEHRRTREENVRLRENLREIFPKTELIGRSPAMKRVVEFIQMVAPTDATVLVTGESGTGKEVVARAIHAAGPRRCMPMVTIHCGALTETLLESELFGHERGAFTGAQYRKKGKFEIADGGTVFLDEISDISLKTQTDLLRVLQEKEVVRVGSHEPIKVDFRCIAATNKELDALVKAGTFRPDLFYRLHVLCIDLPPLRDRREDIPLLVEYFVRKFCGSTNRSTIPRVSSEAMDLLMGYEWRGNVRELENAVERALVVGRGTELTPANFFFQLNAAPAAPSARTLEEVE
ncbi:MAG TPA: sigma-54 dependent transcriptional regulator, partial [Bryobacteraceae bacterium]|nr:sigma-54 dependent transcriptional regulator [Bryobacteraceae bacterium]